MYYLSADHILFSKNLLRFNVYYLPRFYILMVTYNTITERKKITVITPLSINPICK